MASNETALTTHSHSGVDFDLKRREVEAMEEANKIAKSQVLQNRVFLPIQLYELGKALKPIPFHFK